MKRKKLIKIIRFIITIAVICAGVSFVKHMEDKKTAEKAAVEAEKEEAEKQVRQTNNSYTKYLYIKGDFSYEGNKIYAENLKYNDNKLMVDVEFVNSCNENQFTIEQLYEEYEAFLNGEDREKYKGLDEYIKDFDYHGSIYDDYCTSINNELELIREEKRKKGQWVGIDIEDIREVLNRVSVHQIMYADRLYIKGDFSYEEYKLSAENPKYNDKLLMVDVGFVNACNENQQYTIEQLYEEYNAYINGESEDKYINLEKYIEIIDYYRDGSVYADYCDLVYDELKSMRMKKQKKGEEIIIDNESKKETENNRRDVSATQIGIVGGSPEEIREAINNVNEREMSAIHRMALLAEIVNKLGE